MARWRSLGRSAAWRWIGWGSLGFGLPFLVSQAAATTEATDATSSMSWFQAAVLGMVQGLTEFLPISSTAHLKVVPVALGWGDPGVSFTAVIQLGSIAAVLWYFWKDLSELTQGSLRAIRWRNYQAQEFRIAVGIAVGTIPIVILGLLLKSGIVIDYENSPLRSLTAIALASIFMSLFMAIAEVGSAHKRGFDTLGRNDGIWTGIAQSLALIPGVSRSGATITAGLYLGLQRATAARFSFLLGIPAITLAGLVELPEIFNTSTSNVGVGAMLIGLISATVFSYLAIAWLIRYLQTQNTWAFIWYRLIFGVAILLAIWAQLPWTANA